MAETIYEFEAVTEKDGANVPADISAMLLQTIFYKRQMFTALMEEGFNLTVPNSVNGPALLVVFAKSASNARISSFAAYAFAHNSNELTSRDTFLRLSPLNHTLTALHINPETVLSKVYALTFNYAARLIQIASDNQTAIFSIPRFADASPTVLVVRGWNSTGFL